METQSGKAMPWKNNDFDLTAFNLQNYVEYYKGYTKIARLVFIVENIPPLKINASILLIEELKRGMNTSMYSKVWSSLDISLQQQIGYDDAWLQTTRLNAEKKLELLDADLTSAKSSRINENIRQAHNDMGHLQYQIGNLNDALKCFLRTRDFCTVPRHTCEMCLNVITSSIDLNQFFNANNFINKVSDDCGDKIIIGKLRAASGLVELRDGQFKQAALKFLHVDTALGNQFNVTISADDIATYGTICALATFSRSELSQHLVENKSFISEYLSLNPDMKNLALSFHSGDYGTALSLLPIVKSRLLIDMHIHAYADRLMVLVSERVLLQYFAPYCSVDLNRMASSLQMSSSMLEESLVALISSGKLSARIDAEHNVLLRRELGARQAMLDKVAAMSRVHTRALKRDMLRLSMMQQGFVVDSCDGYEGMDRGPSSGVEGDMRVGGGGGGVAHRQQRRLRRQRQQQQQQSGMMDEGEDDLEDNDDEDEDDEVEGQGGGGGEDNIDSYSSSGTDVGAVGGSGSGDSSRRSMAVEDQVPIPESSSSSSSTAVEGDAMDIEGHAPRGT